MRIVFGVVRTSELVWRTLHTSHSFTTNKNLSLTAQLERGSFFEVHNIYTNMENYKEKGSAL
jgi:hypothetical protein